VSGEGTAWLAGLRNFESDRRVTKSPLADTEMLLEKLSDPHRAYKVIHVAGTNGKGSVVAFLEALLLDAGFRVGAYTSPHLCDLTERIRVNQEAISWDALDQELTVLQQLCRAFSLSAPTHFEALTVAALSWFASEGIEIAIVEVGLGGMEDATNVVQADVAVITSIASDHLEQLGPTLADVTRHKLGIVKDSSVVVLGTVPQEVEGEVLELLKERESYLWGRDIEVEERLTGVGGQIVKMTTPKGKKVVGLSRMGQSAAQAAVLAATAAEVLTARAVSEERLGRASQACLLPGRFEVVGYHPVLLVDTAHNLAALRLLAETVLEVFGADMRWKVVLGFTHNRNPVELWGGLADLDVTEVAGVDVGVPVSGMRAAVEASGVAFVERDLSWVSPESLADWAGREEDAGVIVTGSHLLVSRLICQGGEEPAR